MNIKNLSIISLFSLCFYISGVTEKSPKLPYDALQKIMEIPQGENLDERYANSLQLAKTNKILWKRWNTSDFQENFANNLFPNGIDNIDNVETITWLARKLPKINGIHNKTQDLIAQDMKKKFPFHPYFYYTRACDNKNQYLLACIERHNINTALYLLDKNNFSQNTLNKALLFATPHSLELIDRLIQLGANVNAKSKRMYDLSRPKGSTSLSIATYWKNSKIVQYLLRKGANFYEVHLPNLDLDKLENYTGPKFYEDKIVNDAVQKGAWSKYETAFGLLTYSMATLNCGLSKTAGKLMMNTTYHYLKQAKNFFSPIFSAYKDYRSLHKNHGSIVNHT